MSIPLLAHPTIVSWFSFQSLAFITLITLISVLYGFVHSKKGRAKEFYWLISLVCQFYVCSFDCFSCIKVFFRLKLCKPLWPSLTWLSDQTFCPILDFHVNLVLSSCSFSSMVFWSFLYICLKKMQVNTK